MDSSSSISASRRFWRAGEPFVWASAAALTLTLLTALALLGVVLVNGLGVLWPYNQALITLEDGSNLLGPVTDREPARGEAPERVQIKVGNRDLYGLDFRWVALEDIAEVAYPAEAVVVERLEYGDFHGFVQGVDEAAARPDVEEVVLMDAAGTTITLPVAQIVRLYRPNQMGLWNKIGFYLSKLKELVLAYPRESNTEGGLFPAIYGTVTLVFLMSLVSFPLGVLAGVYLTEYAKEGALVRAVHIAVNNLAGIPSIVYGMFGLGFFVYGVGGLIDRVFFSERLPDPTFGTGGILWASMTLGLLTVPVVIVATEEALQAVPRGVREGSYALGATRLQTLVRTVLPMASPGIMTGLILAMARAAGEVAPLMITGVVKLAPALPVDTEFPFIHLERKFMHLGFHIYDVGFQSPNVEAAKPMVFVTALLLVFIVLIMSSVAMVLRQRMRKRYALRTL